MSLFNKLVILALFIGGTALFIYWLSPSVNIPDPVPEQLEQAALHSENIDDIIQTASLDIIQHKQDTIREVVVYRDSIRQNVRALPPDSLAISFDEFLRDWIRRPSH